MIKKFAGIGILVLFFIAILWLLCFGIDGYANNSLVVQVRKYVFTNLRSKMGLTYKSLPFLITPVQKISVGGSDMHVYALLGKFEKIDFNEQRIYLKGRDGLSYGFDFYNGSSDRNYSNQNQFFYEESNGVGDAKTKIIELDKIDFEAGNLFGIDDVFLIYWIDNRSLKTIISELKTDLLSTVNSGKRVSYYQKIYRFVYAK